jgi:hypothetical protein
VNEDVWRLYYNSPPILDVGNGGRKRASSLFGSRGRGVQPVASCSGKVQEFF